MIRVALRWVLALAMATIGVLHFVAPTPFVRIVPRALPAPLLLVYVSGIFEVAGGLGLLVSRTRRLAGWGLIALYVSVFPANINMLVHRIALDASAPPPPLWALWARLPLQLVLIALAWWVSREPQATRAGEFDRRNEVRR